MLSWSVPKRDCEAYSYSYPRFSKWKIWVKTPHLCSLWNSSILPITFSQEKQKENVDIAFREMMAELGHGSIGITLFDPSRDPFRAVHQTTWKELIDQGWLEEHEVEVQTFYRLTGAGWVEGLWRVGV